MLWSAVAALAVGLAHAQSVVVPNAYTTLTGTTGYNSLLRDAGNPRTYQCGIAASELSALSVGAEIVGLSFRVYSGATAVWPATATSWNNYDITLAEAALPIPSFSTTFAANMKNPVAVRKGPMTIPACTYAVAASNPNPFDTFYFAFQRPYTYAGGDLVYWISHDGNTASTYAYHDAVSSSTATYGLARIAGSYNATTSSTAQTVFFVARLHYGYGPAGCSGANGSLNLILSHHLVAPTPAPGSVNLAVTNGQPHAVGGILIAPTPGVVPVPLPGGSNLLLYPLFLAHLPFQLDPSGRFDLHVRFPAATLGVELQAYATDTTTPAGFVATNAVSFQMRP
ncbi:MAG: hypothetical protein JXB32_24145 [Deltaproteobacteria bacterium]|nr:hypothetical protein [Deltaproteobacteria bacterium]